MLLLGVVWGVFGGLSVTYYVVTHVNEDLPDDLRAALDYQPNRASRVYSADGELIGEFFLQKRVVIGLERVPRHVQDAFISAEDSRFWEHPGFDPIGIARAAYANYKSGATRQGASTITQQVTRMLLLSNERTYVRKMKEVILAVRLERELTKADILHMYLNHVYLGRGAYGVQAGAEIYFGKDADQLTVAEGAMLAGLVQAPSRYAPHRNMAAARARQRYVLDRMVDDGYITVSDRDAGLYEPLALVDPDQDLNHVAAPYFVEHIRQWAQDRYGYSGVFRGGLRIYTTLDTRMQRSAEVAVRDGLVALDRRIGFRGPLGHLEGGDFDDFDAGPLRPYLQGLEEAGLTAGGAMLPDVAYIGVIAELPRGKQVAIDLGPERLPLEEKDARKLRAWRGEDGASIQIGDLLPVSLGEDAKGNSHVELAQAPDVQGALVTMDPHTGRVLAMVGGYDYLLSQYNRATQAHRQIGSAIKPFIYATAMDRGFTHLDLFDDAPVAVPTAAGMWTPQNYDGKYSGPVTLRTGVAMSLNTVSVRATAAVGVDAVTQTLRRLGVESEIPPHISIALGTPDLTLTEVVAGYAAFANGGKRTVPRYVDFVTDASGRVVEDYRDHRPSEQAISPQLAYLTTDLLRTVVKRGTAWRAKGLERPVAGKTGTSTGWRDAWFVGYTTDLLTGVWVGRDDFTPIGVRATGGGVALPIWLQLMKAAHPDTAPSEFPIPDDILFAQANEYTGKPAHGRDAPWIPFARGTLPGRFKKGVELSGFTPTAP